MVRPLRLPPGCDLRRELEALLRAQPDAAGFVVCGIGSLDNPRLRLAGEERETALTGPYEVVSLGGSLTADGAHLDMSIAARDGSVVGGHVCYGNTVRTTMEVLLAGTPQWLLTREADPRTGHAELVVRPADTVPRA
jgi:predicted DNA-binding protein with PD1-like motif